MVKGLSGESRVTYGVSTMLLSVQSLDHRIAETLTGIILSDWSQPVWKLKLEDLNLGDDLSVVCDGRCGHV